MLHDPRHDKTPSLAGFALFVASKPADATYNWPNCRACAVGQYLESLGIEPTGFSWDGELQVMNVIAKGSALAEDSDPTLWAFGKLADRILKHQMETV
jgi:hypothetical protein